MNPMPEFVEYTYKQLLVGLIALAIIPCVWSQPDQEKEDPMETFYPESSVAQPSC